MSSSTSDRKRRRPVSDEAGAVSKNESVKKPRVEDRRSIFVRSLPANVTNESLAEFFSQYFPVKHAVVVSDQKTKESRGFGFVTFADADDAKDAQKALDKKDWDGKRIRVDIAEPRHRNAASGEAAAAKPSKIKGTPLRPETKLIVRNLPWSIKTSDQLAKLFISFGKVKFADLPQNKGKLKGFGFVTIRGRPNAEKALETINGKMVDGRTLAVDWAVDKGTWEQQQTKTNENGKAGKKKESDESDNDGDSDVASAQDKDALGEKDAVPKNRDAQLDADLANFMKSYMQNMEDEDDDNEEEEEEEEEEGKDDGNEDILDIELEDDDNEHGIGSSQPVREKTSDNSSTLFVRNLPFSTTDEQLKTFFTHFGKVRYARVVVDRVTEKPAGTGFVCFLDKADAKACIVGAPLRTQQASTGVKNSILQDENADPTGKYTMDGRVLQVVQAVGKEEAGTLAENSLAKRREKDKRKLFLLAEGAIGSNSPLYGLLTPVEVRMRQASAAQRKKLVQKNPMLHVSLTRLALRNIPRNVGSKELKELARKAVVGFAKDVKEGRRQPLSKEENARDGKDAKEKERERKLKKKGIVRQAKIVFEDTKGSKVSEASGAGKSRGYGFIEYASHRWALMGLRYLNGHQLEAGEDNGKKKQKQRLIAEFAIENAQVVQRRHAAEEKSAKASQEKGVKEEDEEEEDDKRPGKEDEKGEGKGKASKSQGKREKREKVGKKTKGKGSEAQEDVAKPTDAKAAMQQKLIARKRLMRKKKAVARSKK